MICVSPSDGNPSSPTRRITVSKKTAKKAEKIRIGDFCRKEILKGVKPAKIVKKAHKRANGGNVNGKHIAWYVWDMKQESSKHYTTDLPKRYQS